MQGVRLRRNESYKVCIESNGSPFELHHHVNEGGINLSKNYLKYHIIHLTSSTTFIPISWSLPRWKIRHQILQDLIDAVRKPISRVPPFSGGKWPQNNAAQESNHTFETVFRHETCLPAT